MSFRSSPSSLRSGLSALALSLALGGLLLACRPAQPASSRFITARGEEALLPGADPVAAGGGQARAATLDGKLRLLGARLPDEARRGARVEVVLWWQVVDVFADSEAKDLRVFVHGQAPFAELNQTQGDHALPLGEVPLSSLLAGDVVEDRAQLVIPVNYPADVLDVRAGLYQGKKRWQVDEDEAHGGDDRVHVGKVRVVDGPPSLPVAKAKKRTAEVNIDGVLDEADWQAAERLGPFVSYDGKRSLSNPTWARIVWDEDHLYVAFECDDKDIHTPYDRRDDPLYESEAVEIFIDADGDLDEYVELQAAPNDVHFDAAFKGGRRKGFDTSYNVSYETKAKLEGTLNDDTDRDTGWVSEWRIPIAELKDEPEKPKPGTSWRINLFRLDRLRQGGRVVGSEASAWSSPLSGDFHNIARFGTLTFVE